MTACGEFLVAIDSPRRPTRVRVAASANRKLRLASLDRVSGAHRHAMRSTLKHLPRMCEASHVDE